MNPRTSLALAAALAAAAPAGATAQGPFEGVVTMMVKQGSEGLHPVKYSIKGNKARLDGSMAGMQVFAIYDGATRTMDMVMPAQRMYVERTFDRPTKADSAAATTTFAWTGKKETIAGHECEHATVTAQDGSETDVCLARDLGSFVPMGGSGGRGRQGGAGLGERFARLIGNRFPLKAVQNGEVQMQVTKIEKKSLKSSLFKVPAGLQKVDMPGGGGG